MSCVVKMFMYRYIYIYHVLLIVVSTLHYVYNIRADHWTLPLTITLIFYVWLDLHGFLVLFAHVRTLWFCVFHTILPLNKSKCIPSIYMFILFLFVMISYCYTTPNKFMQCSRSYLDYRDTCDYWTCYWPLAANPQEGLETFHVLWSSSVYFSTSFKTAQYGFFPEAGLPLVNDVISGYEAVKSRW